MDHWRMARRLGLSSDEFWSLTPVQFDWFVSDWWEEQEVERLQLAQLESTVINLFNIMNRGENDPPVELAETRQLVVFKRPVKKKNKLKTVAGWVDEAEFTQAQTRIQQEAQDIINNKRAGIYRG